MSLLTVQEPKTPPCTPDNISEDGRFVAQTLDEQQMQHLPEEGEEDGEVLIATSEETEQEPPRIGKCAPLIAATLPDGCVLIDCLVFGRPGPAIKTEQFVTDHQGSSGAFAAEEWTGEHLEHHRPSLVIDPAKRDSILSIGSHDTGEFDHLEQKLKEGYEIHVASSSNQDTTDQPVSNEEKVKEPSQVDSHLQVAIVHQFQVQPWDGEHTPEPSQGPSALSIHEGDRRESIEGILVASSAMPAQTRPDMCPGTGQSNVDMAARPAANLASSDTITVMQTTVPPIVTTTNIKPEDAHSQLSMEQTSSQRVHKQEHHHREEHHHSSQQKRVVQLEAAGQEGDSQAALVAELLKQGGGDASSGEQILADLQKQMGSTHEKLAAMQEQALQKAQQMLEAAKQKVPDSEQMLADMQQGGNMQQQHVRTTQIHMKVTQKKQQVTESVQQHGENAQQMLADLHEQTNQKRQQLMEGMQGQVGKAQDDAHQMLQQLQKQVTSFQATPSPQQPVESQHNLHQEQVQGQQSSHQQMKQEQVQSQQSSHQQMKQEHFHSHQSSHQQMSRQQVQSHQRVEASGEGSTAGRTLAEIEAEMRAAADSLSQLGVKQQQQSPGSQQSQSNQDTLAQLEEQLRSIGNMSNVGNIPAGALASMPQDLLQNALRQVSEGEQQQASIQTKIACHRQQKVTTMQCSAPTEAMAGLTQEQILQLQADLINKLKETSHVLTSAGTQQSMKCLYFTYLLLCAQY